MTDLLLSDTSQYVLVCYAFVTILLIFFAGFASRCIQRAGYHKVANCIFFASLAAGTFLVAIPATTAWLGNTFEYTLINMLAFTAIYASSGAASAGLFDFGRGFAVEILTRILAGGPPYEMPRHRSRLLEHWILWRRSASLGRALS